MFSGFEETAWEHKSRFGVIYTSEAGPSHVLIAFRGTATPIDWMKDVQAGPVDFKPYSGELNEPVEICAGFNSIYTYAQFGQSSIQTQIFSILEKLEESHGISKISITGHSLGAALASIFTFDAAISGYADRVSATTFACSKAGYESWQKAFDETYGLKDKLVRVYNYYDIVPTLPPGNNLKHIGNAFQVRFDVLNHYWAHYLARHSINNYWTVVSHAVNLNPQVWVCDDFPDHSGNGYTMKSEAPVFDDTPEWALIEERLRHDHKFARRVSDLANEHISKV